MEGIQYYAILFLVWLVSTLVIRAILTKTRPNLRLPPSPVALPIIGHLHLLGPLPHQSFHKLSTHYGPLIRLRLGSVPAVIASTPDTAKEILKTNEISFTSRPLSSAARHLTYGSSGFILAPCGHYWKFMKKLCMSELLGSRTLDMMLPIRRLELRRFLQLLLERSEAGEPVDLSAELSTMTNNVISMMVMRKRCGRIEGEDEVRRLLLELTELIGKFNLGDFIGLCRKLDLQGLEKRYKDLHGRLDGVMERIIEEHEEERKVRREMGVGGGDCARDLIDSLLDISEDEKAEMKLTRDNIKGFVQGIERQYEALHLKLDGIFEGIIKEHEVERKAGREMDAGGGYAKDLLDTMLDISEDEKAEMKLTREDIKAFIQDIFAAGTDTSAITTEWALAELINHPAVPKKAREEVDVVVGNERLVEESDIPNLPYIQAIIKETLRLHPAAPLVFRKAIDNSEISGYRVPSDTHIFINVWAIGRNPNYWENPLEFCPERFIPSHSSGSSHQLDIRGQHYHLLPFGSGRRACPGISLAMQVMQTTVAALVQSFDLKINNSKDGEGNACLDITEGAGMTVPRAKPLVCFPITRISPLLLDPTSE